jgi:hypothetical protein
VNRFWSQVRKRVESEATAVEALPHRPVSRAAKVAFAMPTARAWATAGDR